MPEITRRSFVKASALAGTAITLGAVAARASASKLADPTWTGRPMRWGQLTLVEDDPGTFDAQFWLDYFKRTQCDAVCLSAGGCVAYYPTEVPYHHRSAWLGNRDVFGDLVKGCRAMGMVVVGRTDPHATYDDVRVAHPDWLLVGEDGQQHRHWSSPEMWLTCALGPYNFDFMTDVKREIMTRYRLDGIFINRWDGSGTCYCEHCRSNFRAASGLEIPRTTDPRDPTHRTFVLWRQERLFELWRKWDETVRAINPDSCVIPNTGGGAGSSLDMKRIGERAPTLMADRQSRHGLVAPWANGKNAKEYRATMGRKPIVGIFSVGLDDEHRWKDSVQNADEIRLWVADGIANGMRPWFTKFGGSINDPRWLKPVEDMFSWCVGAERYLRNDQALARVAIVYSQQTSWFCPDANAPARSVEDSSLGWYQALVESRIPFEMVHDRLLGVEDLRAFKTLILPNIMALSDEQCAQIREFVARGGGLIATSETSLRDEWGAPRTDFGLAELFGASWAGSTEGPMKNAYLRLEHDSAPGSPLFTGLEDAPRIIHGVWRVDVKSRTAGYRPPITHIPSYPDLPMEKVYARQPRTNIAQVYLSEKGDGRVIYFPWDLDRTFWEVLSTDHLKLMRNAVVWASNEEQPVRVEGDGVLDVTLWRQADSITVHLVNLTNPMMMKGPVRKIVPIGAQTVHVHVAGLNIRGVKLLVSGEKTAYRQTGEWLEVNVPSIFVHEVVAIDT
jgi:hypothetical protein